MTPGQGVLVYGHLPPARIALRPWFKDPQLRRAARGASRGAVQAEGYREDHGREPHSAEAEAARIADWRNSRVTRFRASRRSSSTATRNMASPSRSGSNRSGRRDVLDLARVLESEPGGHVVTGWSLLSPSRRHPEWRLLLHVSFERPVLCDFVIRFDITEHPSDELRVGPPAPPGRATGSRSPSTALVDSDRPVVWVPAPAVRDCVFELLASSVPDRATERTSRLDSRTPSALHVVGAHGARLDLHRVSCRHGFQRPRSVLRT